MANNRLYIGNKETKEFECISKSEDYFRRLRTKDLRLLNNIVETECGWNKEINLVLFRESDTDLYNYFHSK